MKEIIIYYLNCSITGCLRPRKYKKQQEKIPVVIMYIAFKVQEKNLQAFYIPSLQ